MANRRMFSKAITETDSFLDMPLSSQALYFHLGIHADDDGFVQPKRVMRLTGASDDELKLLVHKSFVLPFDSGVIVITHWKENNYIRPDRYSPTVWRKEIDQLTMSGNVYQMSTIGIPNVHIGRKVRKEEKVGEMSTNVDLGKPDQGKGYKEFLKAKKALAEKKAL